MNREFAWLFLSLNGRIDRQLYWLSYALLMVGVVAIHRLMESLSVYLLRPPGRSWDQIELSIALMLPTLAAVVLAMWPLTVTFTKRLHDLNLSAWWVLILPAAGLGSKMLNIDNYAGFIIIALIGATPGTRGGNRFGPDPLARDADAFGR
jgi:uncharacterized membrane protein YhaH (DUF805 family)